MNINNLKQLKEILNKLSDEQLDKHVVIYDATHDNYFQINSYHIGPIDGDFFSPVDENDIVLVTDSEKI